MSLLDRATLDVLAHAADVGIPDAVELSVARHDPLLRPAIRRRVQRALDAARAKTQRDGIEHILRVAFVVAHPSAPADAALDDEKAIVTLFSSLSGPLLPPRKPSRPDVAVGAYREVAGERVVTDDEAPRPRKRRFWPATTGLVASVVVIALSAAAVAIAPSLIPTDKERFQKTPLGTALGDDLSTVVANAGPRGDAAAVDAAMARLTAPAVKKQSGEEAIKLLLEALDAVPAASGSSAESVDEAAVPVFRAVNQANEAWRARGVPALLHAYASGASGNYHVWLTSYYVERRDALDAGGLSVDVAWGRRLDFMNLADSALYKGAHEAWVVLSRDLVDEELVEELLPVLARGGALPLEAPREVGADKPVTSTLTGLAAARAVRAELAVAPRAAEALLAAITERNQALLGLQEARYVAAPTYRIDLPPSRVRSFKNAVDDGGAYATLASKALSAQTRVKVAARKLEPAIVRLALLREEQFASRLEEEKHRRAAPGGGVDVRSTSIACADLSTMARAQASPSLAFYLLARRAHIRPTSSEARAAAQAVVSVLHALAEKAPPTGHSAEIDDGTFARAFEEPDARLRDAGKRAYSHYCGRPLPAFSRRAK